MTKSGEKNPLPGFSAEHLRPLQHFVARRSIWQCWFWHWPTTAGNLSGPRGTSAPTNAPYFDTPWMPEGWDCRHRDVREDKWRQKDLNGYSTCYPHIMDEKSQRMTWRMGRWKHGKVGEVEGTSDGGNEWGMGVRAAAWVGGWAATYERGARVHGLANWREGAMTDWRAKKGKWIN